MIEKTTKYSNNFLTTLYQQKVNKYVFMKKCILKSKFNFIIVDYLLSGCYVHVYHNTLINNKLNNSEL